MKRKQLLTKTLLIAAMLFVGINVSWAETTTVGTDNTTGWWTAFSDYYTLEPNQTLTISFKNYTDKSANANNWIGVATTDADRGASGYYEYFVLRADNYGWGGAWVYSNLSSYYNWETFKADMDGATVAMTVTRNGSIVTLHADITKAGDSTPTYWEEYWTACGSATDNIRFFLTTEKGHLTDIASSIAANGNTSESTGWGTLNAQIDFSNAISEGAVAGRKGSMTLSNLEGDFKFELGYTSGDPATTVLGDVLRVGNGTGTVTIPDAELAGDRDEVIISFDYWFGALSGRKAGFYLKDAEDKNIAGYYLTWYNNGSVTPDINTFGLVHTGENITSIGSSNAQDDKICVDNNKTRFELHINYATGTMYAVQYTNGVWKQTTTPVNIPDGVGKFKKIIITSNYNNYGTRRCWFDNLLIQSKRGDYSASDVSYTVKFVDGNGTEVKADDTSREALTGTAISDLASTDDMTTFYNDGDIANNNTVEFAGATNKYVYKSVSAVNSSSEAITELEAGAIVTVVYDKHVKYNYAVKQKLGDAAATDVATGSLWDNETYTYYFPIGVKSGDDYYFTKANASEPKYGGTLTKDATTVTINYTLDPTVYYYVEGEDIESSTGTFGYYSSVMAGGSSGVLNADDGNLITSLPAGIYTLTAQTVGRGDGDSRKIKFYKGSVDDANIILTATPAYEGATANSIAFELASETNILVKGAAGGGANGNGLDYVIIKKLPDNVSATISASGYTSLSSAYALDFSEVEGLTAFVVKEATSDGVTLSSVNEAPAETGLILKGTIGETYNIPVVASAEEPAVNLLSAAVTATVVEDGSVYILKGGKFCLLEGAADQAARTIPAGKAYLPKDKVTTSKVDLAVAFEEETVTGIESVQEFKGSKVQSFYDLQGRRVSQPTKGMYIMDGKKVVVK